MTDRYTRVLKNLANIKEEKSLEEMEAEYTSLRLAEIATGRSINHFDLLILCEMHYHIFLRYI